MQLKRLIMDTNNNTYYEYNIADLNLFSMGRVGQCYEDIKVDVLADYVFDEYVRLHPDKVTEVTKENIQMKKLFIDAQ